MREEALVEDLLLVGDELAHAVGHLHRAALQFDHPDGDAVQVDDQVSEGLGNVIEFALHGDGEGGQPLVIRIRQLAERYARTLPQLTDDVATLTSRVEEHLKRMGAVWN